MTRILLVGYNPPQLLREAKIEAAHYRTWQFLQPLLDDGHTVCLCAGPNDGERVEIPEAWRSRLTHYPIQFGERGWRNALQAAHDLFGPDCIVAVNFSHCLYTTKLRTDRPIWMDIYGDMLTIMQAACYRGQSDRGLHTSIAFMRQVLHVGDVFSSCGQPQRHALVGELAMAGRLNHHTFGYEFVREVLPGSPPPVNNSSPSLNSRRTLLRQSGISNEDFVVLWCGGYNAWTDVDTLFRGLEIAMEHEPRLNYVSVGASTYVAQDNVYDRFLSLVNSSPYRSRFHMLGWRPWHEVATYYHESDIGINIDALHYETIYGTRTRLVEMMGAGLPVLTSLGAELSYMLRDAGVALTFEIGDWLTMSQQLTCIAGDPALRNEMACAVRAYAATHLSFETTTRALRDWVNCPQRAPDKVNRSSLARLQGLRHNSRAQVRRFLWRFLDYDK